MTTNNKKEIALMIEFKVSFKANNIYSEYKTADRFVDAIHKALIKEFPTNLHELRIQLIDDERLVN